jgi:hypothetical protein
MEEGLITFVRFPVFLNEWGSCQDVFDTKKGGLRKKQRVIW